MANLKAIKVSHDIPGVCWITLNRPEKYNAWNYQMYDEFTPTLKEANSDPNCKLIVLTGKGKFFSSGNDQSNFFDPDFANRRDVFRELIGLLIDITKPMIALVNGPAVGMGVTMLNHFDVVIASDTATFSTPFTRLALCAEGCSSYVFPRVMGYSNAAEMLLFNKKATAKEMLAWGMVSRIIPHDVFEERTRSIIEEYSQLSANALEKGKGLIRPKSLKDKLHAVNHNENDVLRDLIVSPEALEAVMKFTSRKSKL